MKKLWDSWSSETIEHICIVSGIGLFVFIVFFLGSWKPWVGMAFFAAVLIAFFIMSLCAWIRRIKKNEKT